MTWTSNVDRQCGPAMWYNICETRAVHAHRGQVAFEEGFSGEALPLHADLDSSGVVQGCWGDPHAP